MLIRTHLLLAGKLLKEAGEDGSWGRMERLAFYWGNVRPDVHSPFTRGTHMYEKRVDDIERRWRRMEDAGGSGGLSGVRNMYRMGYILHYMADFFTYVHNNEEDMKHMYRHMTYERELEAWMSAADLSSGDFEALDDFREYLELLHAVYMAGNPSPERDAGFICAGTSDLMKKAMASNPDK